PEHTAGVSVEQGQDPTADEATDDTDDDVGDNAHLRVGAHDLRADPTRQTADDDPANESEGRGCLCCENQCIHVLQFASVRRVLPEFLFSAGNNILVSPLPERVVVPLTKHESMNLFVVLCTSYHS